MTRPDEDRHRLVRAWLEKAEQDLQAADALLAQDPPLRFPGCFHAQQAAEKYLKALLTDLAIDAPRTHDLGMLLKVVGRRERALADRLFGSVILNTYAVEARYPGDQPEPGPEEASDALAWAHRVREELAPLLSSPES